MLAYAYGDEGASIPVQVLEDFICRRYRCLPSQLDEENTRRLLGNLSAARLYEDVMAYRRNPKGGIPASMAAVLELERRMQDGE